MTRASTYTLLSLDRYAGIVGITPAHFAGGVSGTVFPLTNRCSDVWAQYSWQASDAVSREDLALEIANAEQDIANVIGWWPAPTWIAQEVHDYPRHHRPEVYALGGVNVRGGRKSVTAKYAKVISPGRRAVTFVASPSVAGGAVVFSDDDGDGFDETVTVTAATTLTDECELHVYFTGQGGAQEEEIRPARSQAIAGGVFTAVFWSWQFLDPDLWDQIPTNDYNAIDLDDPASYVAAVDVYQEYTDTTSASAQFYWEPQPSLTTSSICSVCLGTGCAACQLTEQDGCVHIRDAERGVLVPTPATYDRESGAWATVQYSICRDPDQVKVWYYAGDLSNENRRGIACDPLSNWWAQTIAMLATARLERPFCNCGPATALAMQWRKDMAFVGETSHNLPYALFDNPFGTRYGEIRAWQRISRTMRDGVTSGVAAIG